MLSRTAAVINTTSTTDYLLVWSAAVATATPLHLLYALMMRRRNYDTKSDNYHKAGKIYKTSDKY